MKKIIDIINEEIESIVQEAGPRVRKLPPTASVMDKINMLMLISRKAYELYHTRRHSETWVYRVREKYGYYWDELYDAVRHTPEWEAYCKANNMAVNINFGDMLA